MRPTAEQIDEETHATAVTLPVPSGRVSLDQVLLANFKAVDIPTAWQVEVESQEIELRVPAVDGIGALVQLVPLYEITAPGPDASAPAAKQVLLAGQVTEERLETPGGTLWDVQFVPL